MRDIVLLSGGLDSTILLWDKLQTKQDRDVVAAWIDYGQRNATREHICVVNICREFNCKLAVYECAELFKYNDVSGLLRKSLDAADTVQKAELVNRNALLLNYIAAQGIGRPTTLYVGAHQTAAPYADCTKQFYTICNRLLKYSTSGMVGVKAPYIKMDKQGVMKRAWDLGLTKKALEMTWSCYYDNECGECPACKNRRRALEMFGNL